MNNTLKVAKWEIQRNLKNKAFLISILITPFMIFLFGLLPTLLAKFETDQAFTIYLVDELGISQNISALNPSDKITFVETTDSRESLDNKIRGSKDQAYVILDQSALESGVINIYTDSESQGALTPVNRILQSAITDYKFKTLGLGEREVSYISQQYQINITPLTFRGDEKSLFERIIPGVFAGILFLTVFTSGTMTFQSALQEKKDKMVELILSSIKAEDLMQGKILGYFVLGLIQMAVWLLFGIPAAQYFLKLPVLEYLLVPELLPMVFFGLAGYLLYSAIFVAIGATMEDAQSGSSFQGMIFLIPMLPLFVIGPIIANPSGTVALIGSFFPLTTPGVMLTRLSVSQNIPSWEILLSAVILLLTIVLTMKLAGKLFRTAILMYGKNATFGEIIKWLRY